MKDINALYTSVVAGFDREAVVKDLFDMIRIPSENPFNGPPKADFGIVGEPTDLRICPAHKGDYAITIRTFGKAVHSSTPEKGHNAIEDMGRVINLLANHDKTLLSRRPHPICGHGRFSMGVIRGGTFVCTVPDICELEVDRRTLPGETAQMISAEYSELLDDPEFFARGICV